ncbi:MAG: ComEC/Rec2 family competence protein [Rhodospirillales bacterium]|nr:ComEC/Rec2 family competence protein [Rhodospirillales bacterium]
MAIPAALARAVVSGAWIEAERGRAALWLPVCMAAGVVFYFQLTWEPPAWVGMAALACWGGLFTLAGARPGWRGLCLGGFAAALGLASCQFATWRAPPMPAIPRHATLVTGIVRAVEALPQGQRVTLEAASLDGGAPLARLVRVRLRKDDALAVGAGDTLRVRALLSRPSPPAWPGAWDLQRDAFFNGMGAYGFALDPAELVARAARGGLARRIQALRETIAGRIAAVLPGPEGPIATTLLTGGTAAIAPADRAAFRDAGLAHLLAIAGLHIGIVMGLVFGFVRLGLACWEWAALRLPVKALAALAALAAGWFYLLLTGAHVPILRSFAMACLVTLGVLVGRRAVSLRGLALAMAALILLAPETVVGVSFQMSFAAVLALIAGYEALRPRLLRLRGDGAWHRRALGGLAALALTSLLAGTASAPYGAYHFGHVQLYFVLANMLAVPLTALWVMPAGLLALALMPLHLEALALLPMGWGVSLILRIAHGVAAWPSSVLAVAHMPGWGLAALSLGLAWLGLWRTRMRLLGVLGLAIGLASPALVRPADVLVSADARLIGLHTPDGVFIEKTAGGSRFTRDAWLQYWGAAAGQVLPKAGQAGPVACSAAGCAWAGRGVLVLRGGPGCAGLVVSAAPIRAACPGAVKIDRFRVWRDGAYAVWLGGAAPLLRSDRQVRGARPWVLGPGTASATPPGLKQAKAEILPPG